MQDVFNCVHTMYLVAIPKLQYVYMYIHTVYMYIYMQIYNIM